MTFRSDIQEIAKTKELIEKTDKALTTAERALKESLLSQRIKVFQDPITGGAGGAGVGAASPATVGATAASGAAINAAKQVLQNNQYPKNNSEDKTQTDNKTESQANAGATSSYSQGNDGQELTEDTSRTESKNLADPDGAGDATWNAIKAALVAQGASAADITRASLNYWSKEAGKTEISDVYSGDAGPKLLSDEVLNAIVGQAVGSALYVELRLDGRDTIPSAAESAAADQLAWENVDTPPYKPGYSDFQVGYYWNIATGYTPAQIYGATPTLVGKAYLPILDANEPANAPHSFVSVTQLTVSSYLVNYNRAVGGPFSFNTSRVACPGPQSTLCTTEPPREDSWPAVGLYYLKLVAGKFIYSIYDSEVPISAQGLQSSVKMASAKTGDEYTIEPAIEGGVMITNDSNPDYLLYYNSKRQLRAIAPIEQYKFYKPR